MEKSYPAIGCAYSDIEWCVNVSLESSVSIVVGADASPRMSRVFTAPLCCVIWV